MKKLNCNQCDNSFCGEHSLFPKFRSNPNTKKCFGFKPYPQKGFSLLELALRKNATSVNELLEKSKLRFSVNNEIHRGFDLVKI